MLTLRAPAKINWFLRVRGKRPDGYHEISSLFQRISLYDDLTIDEAPNISVITEAPIAGDENLVTRAAVSIREASRTPKGARISLKKNIPIAAGMGGGSSDAASALKGLYSLWGLDLPDDRLHDLALGLGSDVPFFLGGPSALVGGRGEHVTPVDIEKSYTLLLLKPGVRIPAGWAYSGTTEFSGEDPDYADNFLKALNGGDFDTLKRVAINDLEGPVTRKYPEVAELKKGLYENGALFSAMSGSGPTVFGVFKDRGGAEEARSFIGAQWSAVVQTLIRGTK